MPPDPQEGQQTPPSPEGRDCSGESSVRPAGTVAETIRANAKYWIRTKLFHDAEGKRKAAERADARAGALLVLANIAEREGWTRTR
jgi:hypothetical protein